jgi:hypothetical protein
VSGYVGLSIFRATARDVTVESVMYTRIYRVSQRKCQAEVIQNHDNENVRNIGQGEPRHTKYKRLKLGGGQAYDRSSH